MNRFSHWSAILVMAVCLVPNGLGAGELSFVPLKLRFDPRFILEVVARQMNVTLRPGIPVPEILLESTTPLRRFQKAIATQWGFEPHVFANAYAVATNEIYLMDHAAYYARRNRTLDDSLAHEYAHYLQVCYFNADLADPSLEIDAIAVQEGFKAAHTASITAMAAQVKPTQYDLHASVAAGTLQQEKDWKFIQEGDRNVD